MSISSPSSGIGKVGGGAEGKAERRGPGRKLSKGKVLK